MNDPEIVPARTGETLWFLDTLMEIKAGAAATGGKMAVLEQLAPPGSATPMHRHDSTDEHFYVLAGEVSFHGPSAAKRCGAGTFVAVSRGTVHGFRVTSAEPARLLVMSVPATFERFVRAVSVKAPSATLPPVAPPPGPDQLAQLAAVGAQHDVVLVGPPPAV